MDRFFHILFYILIGACGFYIVPVFVNIAIILGIFPDPGETGSPGSFRLWLGGGGMWVWIASVLVALGSFFAKTPQTKWALLTAPLYVPALYAAAVLVYF